MISTRRIYIRTDEKRMQNRYFRKLYKEYKIKLKKIDKSSEPMKFTYFKALIAGRAKGKSIKSTITLAAARTAGVLTRTEALNVKSAAIGLDIDVSGMKLTDIRKDKSLQSKIYHTLLDRGYSTEQAAAWWTENIIGSI